MRRTECGFDPRHDALHVVQRLVRKRLPSEKEGIEAFRPCVVSREQIGIAVAFIHLAEICRSRENVVVRIVGIVTESIALAQVAIGAGHDLHEAHRACRRGDWAPMKHRAAAAFLTHDGANPRLWNCELPRRFCDVVLPSIDHRLMRPDGPRSDDRSGNRRQRIGNRTTSRTGLPALNEECARCNESHRVHSGCSLPMMFDAGMGPK